MTDLEQRVNEAVRLLSPISVYNPSGTHTITGDQMDLLRELLQDQQAEINRLKSGQVKLRSMEEAPRDGTEILMKCGSHWNIAYWDEEDESWRTPVRKGDFPVRYIDDRQGWIDLSDLPTEIEAEND